MIFEIVLYFKCCVVWLAPSGPPQELHVTDVDIHEISISWKFPQFPNGIITGFTVSTTTFYVTILLIPFIRYILMIMKNKFQPQIVI